ncbi:MAG: YraN family protein, partial [[Eubacterium] siraeum]|nr:YraN family protein [[Eubacterium] siraeum]
MQGSKISAARGKAGEDAVCGHLKSRGCEIIARNYRIKGGEIDI